MPTPDRTGYNTPTSQTEQYVLNYSFDEVYKILMVGLAAYNPTSNTYDRVQIGADGSLTTAGGGSSSSVSYISQFYTDATYTYICKAVPGTALSASSWQIKRLDSSGNKRYAGGATTFTNAATSLTTVQGYTYS